ncbi:hypothetical protein F4604DRAFT_1900538 [Suillus subluteus]|nr:hypothetical protein F4604DRAFT_1900538 [Suillus subluteus]
MSETRIIWADTGLVKEPAARQTPQDEAVPHLTILEANPLIGPRKPSRRYQSPYAYAAFIAILIVAITIVIFFISPSNDPLDSDVRDRIRKDWDIELRQHQKERLEDDDRIRLREQWGTGVEKHNREVEKRLRRDEEHKIHIREQWEREVEEHDEELNEGRRHAKKKVFVFANDGEEKWKSTNVKWKRDRSTNKKNA